MHQRQIPCITQLRIDGTLVRAVGGVRPPRDCSAIGMGNGFSFLTRLVLNGLAAGALRLQGSLRVTDPERARSLALIGRASKELRLPTGLSADEPLRRTLHCGAFVAPPFRDLVSGSSATRPSGSLRNTPDAPAMLTLPLASLM